MVVGSFCFGLNTFSPLALIAKMEKLRALFNSPLMGPNTLSPIGKIHLESVSKGKIISKTLLKAKGRISSGGSYLVKGKAFEIGGGISNLKMLLEIIFLYLWLFAK